MRHYNNVTYLRNRMKGISGVHSGILRNYTVYSRGEREAQGLNIIVGSMPPYTKLTYTPEHEMSYHISGYGNTYEEAYIRYLGESVERYASVICHKYLENRIVKDSRSNLLRSFEHVLPTEYMNVFTQEQKKAMHSGNSAYSLKDATDCDVMDWVIANQLASPENKILIPASMFFVGYPVNSIHNPSFTTGTACHETIEEAAINAIMEYIQIDAFMAHWYLPLPKYTLKLDSIPRNVAESINLSLGRYQNDYELLIVDYSDQATIAVPVVGVFIISKNPKLFPNISFGVQSALDLDNTIYRGVQESLAVLQMSSHTPISNHNMFERLKTKKDLNFFDLDSNVGYFAMPQFRDVNLEYIKRHIEGEISYDEIKSKVANVDRMDSKERLRWLCKSVGSMDPYACFLDITPPTIYDDGFKVFRCYIPSLLHMSFPSYPYIKHPRYSEIGLDCGTYPHALP